MLSPAQKILNAYKLNLEIENHYLPAVVGDQRFPNPDRVLAIVCAFNRTLTEGPESENGTPGEFRKGTVVINRSEHEPPPWAEVPGLMKDFAEEVVRMWGDDLVKLHAYALWRLNWIHPFFDGNGRTAREFSYFLLCVRHGSLLPGRFTVTA